MKVIQDNSAAVVVPKEYPKEYICCGCGSVILLERATDIKKNIPAKLVDAESLKTGATVPARGFTCPVCSFPNIIG